MPDPFNFPADLKAPFCITFCKSDSFTPSPIQRVNLSHNGHFSGSILSYVTNIITAFPGLCCLKSLCIQKKELLPHDWLLRAIKGHTAETVKGSV